MYAGISFWRSTAVQLSRDAGSENEKPSSKGPGCSPQRRHRTQRASRPSRSAKARSKLSVREPRRLPRGLDRAETAALLASFRSEQDRAMAGLMLFCGLRAAEVLGAEVADVDIRRSAKLAHYHANVGKAPPEPGWRISAASQARADKQFPRVTSASPPLSAMTPTGPVQPLASMMRIIANSESPWPG